MLSYITKRLLLMIPTLFGVMLVTFLVTQFVPGGPVEKLIHQLQTGGEKTGETGVISKRLYRGSNGLDDEKIESLKKLYGFDKPAYIRFIDMIKQYAVFDLGESYYQHETVMNLILSKLPVSLSLGIWTFLLTYLICIPLGIRKASKEGSYFDVVSSTVILTGFAIPGFVLGVFLVVLFGGGSFFDVFPLSGLVSDNWDELSWWNKITDYLWHITLPVIASTVGSFAVMTLLTKNSFLEEMRKQYVMTAKAKGLTQNKVLYRHVFRNALIPLVTGFPSAFIGAFFASSILIEQIFSLDGLGLLAYESVINRDYPVVMGSLYIFTVLGLLAKLITDLTYVLVDPRIQFESVSQ